MKNIIPLIVLLTSFTSFASISVVSDLDDTIKITNSGDEVDATINGIFSEKVFTGMAGFLKEMRAYTGQLHVLTASPTIIKYKIEKTLNKHQIRYDSLIMKSPFSREERLVYKVRELKRLFEANSGDDFILIGDDVGQDPEAYDEIKRAYPNRVLAIYIHAVKDRVLPRSSVKYWTSFDLFLREYEAGRMLKSSVDIGVKNILDESNMKLLFPNFATCPKTPEIWLWQLRTGFARSSVSVAKKINLYCLSRWSVITQY
jgi:hypothetical protein